MCTHCLPLSQYQWSCCIPRKHWRTRTRSTWCSRGGRPWARNAALSGTRHTANSRSDQSASPSTSPSCILRWKSTATWTRQNVTQVFSSSEQLAHTVTQFLTLYTKWGEAVPGHSIQAYRGSRGRAPVILNLVTTRWMINITSRPIYTWQRIGSWVGPTAGLDVLEKERISCRCRHSNPRSSGQQPRHYTNHAFSAPTSTYTTVLSSLSYWFLL